jgi:hypothetical protein
VLRHHTSSIPPDILYLVLPTVLERQQLEWLSCFVLKVTKLLRWGMKPENASLTCCQHLRGKVRDSDMSKYSKIPCVGSVTEL